MNIKKLLKPNFLKILIFFFIGIFYIYFAREDICGAGFLFAFCYKAYGFPLLYFISGNIETASGHIKTLFLGKYFINYGNFLFNPAALILDIILIYLLACFISMLLKNIKIKNKN